MPPGRRVGRFDAVSRRAVPPVVPTLALGLLRRHRPASVALTLLAGLAAAAPMAAWAAGRQAATTVERSLEHARAADVLVSVCPPDFDPARSNPEECFRYYPPEEDLNAIRSLPAVTEVARTSFTSVMAGASPDPGGWRPQTLLSLSDTVSLPTMLGLPDVVVGRLAADGAPDEVMANEALARALRLGPGDRVWMKGGGQAEGADGDGPPVPSTVVGIVRTIADLLPSDADSLRVPSFYARAGWSRAHARDLPPDATAISVWLDDGDVVGFTTGLRSRMRDRSVQVVPGVDPGERANMDQATGYESRAALALAAAAALAVALFLGQAVSRQARAESSDVPTLLALGMTRRQLAAAASARWVPVALGASLVAVVVAIGASALGPIGLARRAPWEPALRADGLVLVAGSAAAVVVVLFSGAVTLYKSRGLADATARSTRALGAVGPPGVRAGVVMARRSLRRGGALPVVSALVGTSLAVAAVITASGGAASLRRVTASPERFGAPWDALIGGQPVPERQQEMLVALAGLPGTTAAAAIPGSTVAVGDRELWIQAMVPIEGIEPVRPVVTAGRAPMADDEIALGSVTMSELGLRMGGEVSLQPQLLGAHPRPYRVVGVTMVADGQEPNVGRGGLVSLAGLERVAPGADLTSQVNLVARVVAGPGRAAALAALEEAFPRAQVPFPLPSSLANAERIAGLPMLLGLAAGALAAVTFTHALIVTIRRNRRELAVYRVLGFTRAQVYGAVATHATLTGFGAAAAGVLLGILGARWGWQALADSFGVASGAVVPLRLGLVSLVGVLVVANLAAAAPGRKAVKLEAAEVLRGE